MLSQLAVHSTSYSIRALTVLLYNATITWLSGDSINSWTWQNLHIFMFKSFMVSRVVLGVVQVWRI